MSNGMLHFLRIDFNKTKTKPKTKQTKSGGLAQKRSCVKRIIKQNVMTTIYT